MIRLTSIRRLLWPALAVLLTAVSASAQTRLLRFPDIFGDRVVFTYGGDLWTASAAGGTATRLTAHPGVELFAKFSPDGQWIAFTGQYDGDEQVYVMPSTGGVPRQLTFYPARGPLAPRWGYDNQVYGWTNDGAARALPIASRFVDAADDPALHRCGGAADPPRRCRCPSPVRAPMPPMAAGWSTRPASATSARRSATAAARPTICSSST